MVLVIELVWLALMDKATDNSRDAVTVAEIFAIVRAAGRKSSKTNSVRGGVSRS